MNQKCEFQYTGKTDVVEQKISLKKRGREWKSTGDSTILHAHRDCRRMVISKFFTIALYMLQTIAA